MGVLTQEYISARSRWGLVYTNGTQVIDLCGHTTMVGQPVNSEASVLEALTTCTNIPMYVSQLTCNCKHALRIYIYIYSNTGTY